jgi:hypothetical protein
MPAAPAAAGTQRLMPALALRPLLLACPVPPCPAGRWPARPPRAPHRQHRHRPLGELQPQGLRFNDAIDEAVLKPVATAYRDVVPQLVRTGVSNVLGNIGDIWSAANHLLQGKLHPAWRWACASSPTPSSAWAACSTWPPRWAWTLHLRRLRPDAGPLGRGQRALPGAALPGPQHLARQRLPGGGPQRQQPGAAAVSHEPYGPQCPPWNC